MMRSLMAKLLFLALALVLAGCGVDEETEDGGDDGSIPENQSVANGGITLIKSGEVLETGIDQELEVTARVRGDSGLLLEEVPVSFSFEDDSDAEFRAAEGTTRSGGAFLTDEAGSVTILVSSSTNRTNRTLDLVATVDGSDSEPLAIPVSGTSISVEAPSSATAQQEVDLSAQLRDSQGDAIAGETLSFSSASGGAIVEEEARTDAQGRVEVTYSADAPSSGNTDTITVEGAGATTTTDIDVTLQQLIFTKPTGGSRAEVPLDENQDLEVELTDENGDLVDSAEINFSTTRGSISPSNPMTNNGVGTATLTPDGTAGPAIITAEVDGGAVAKEEVLFVATEPDSMDLQVNPSTIGPEEESDVLAIVRDANDQLVKNQKVRFSITEDTTGSTLSASEATTDQFGRATTRLIAGDASGSNDGVEISAEAVNEGITDSAVVTVSGDALFITIGTGNEITEESVGNSSENTLYSKSYTVLVTDSSGAPVEDARVSLELIPLMYAKGNYSFNGDLWVQSVAVECPSEDADRDGVLDDGEDNNNDEELTPGNIATLSASSVTTDSSGFAGFDISYAQEFAEWVEVALSGSAEVAGTESTRTIDFYLPILADDLTEEGVPPAGQPSPFGESANCGDTQ